MPSPPSHIHCTAKRFVWMRGWYLRCSGRYRAEMVEEYIEKEVRMAENKVRVVIPGTHWHNLNVAALSAS
jgi:hypothetical protein